MSRRYWLFGLPLCAVLLFAAWELMPREAVKGDPGDPEQVLMGKAIYGRDCARCHGDDLSGEFGWLKKETDANLSEQEIERMLQTLDDVAPAHDNSGVTRRHDDETLFHIIKDGAKVALSKEESRMPGFQDRLNDEEIWGVVAFLKSQWTDTEGAPE